MINVKTFGSGGVMQLNIQNNSQPQKKFLRKRASTRGQGLVEYALIIALVAIVSIVTLAVIGPAAQRIFGLVTGALGTRANTSSLVTFDVNQHARCGYLAGTGTGFYMQFYATVPASQLQISTDNNVVLTLAADSGLPGRYVLSQLLDSGDNTGKCPRSVVIQSGKEVLLTPVEIKNW
jgi:Flp pilus assembly pilin Flp